MPDTVVTNNDNVDDYIALIDGGAAGALYNDIVDYFYYCQIRTQGENSMELRRMKGMLLFVMLWWGLYSTSNEFIIGECHRFHTA